MREQNQHRAYNLTYQGLIVGILCCYAKFHVTKKKIDSKHSPQL